MKMSFKRTIAGAVLGITLAMGGIAIAAIPANAAVSTVIPNPPADLTEAVGANSIQFVPATFSEPLNSVTYTQTISGNNVAFRNYFTSTGYPITFDGSGKATLTLGIATYHFTKVNPTTIDITIDYPTPSIPTGFRGFMTTADVDARGTTTWTMKSATPASTGVAENVVASVSYLTTWGNPVVTVVPSTPANQAEAVGANSIQFVPATFSEPLNSVTYTQTISGNNVAFTNYFTSTGYPINFDGSGKATLTLGIATYHFTKVNPTTIDITIDYPTSSIPTGFRGFMTTADVDAQGTTTWTMKSATPASTGVAENVVASVSYLTTWGDIVDTPVIAPAIAGIALLGAAGVGGTVFTVRRKKKAAADA
ncbi:hypothetical protein ACRAWB_14485 [Leifsonia poae]|uniref:hypothetical protein n=1 Tax=Leifsonia poae TaxID=110933 RepID=UPI003D68ADDF